MKLHLSDKLGVFIRCCIRHFPVYVTKKFKLLKLKCNHISSKRQFNQSKKLQDLVDYEINERFGPIFRLGDWNQVVIFHVLRMS